MCLSWDSNLEAWPDSQSSIFTPETSNPAQMWSFFQGRGLDMRRDCRFWRLHLAWLLAGVGACWGCETHSNPRVCSGGNPEHVEGILAVGLGEGHRPAGKGKRLRETLGSSQHLFAFSWQRPQFPLPVLWEAISAPSSEALGLRSKQMPWISSNKMDETEAHYTEWSKPER